MSKFKPEVGDVWLNLQGKKYYIFNIFEDRIVKGFSTSTGRMDSFCLLIDDFLDLYTYLGKSKANMEQFFEVENNGRCVEDNIPHAESTVLFKDLEKMENEQMIYDVGFLVTRLNGKIKDVVPIQDFYTECQISLKSEHLTDEDILKFYSHMSKDYQNSRMIDVRTYGKLYEEGEAKDLTCELSQYSIGIEHKEIYFKD